MLLASGTFAVPEPLDAWRFAWNGRTIRGASSVVALADGKPGLVAVLPIDAYLYGVLSREISSSWARGAQGAQAIVARTYTLAKLRPGKPYDVVAGDADQNFGDVESESVEGREAVDATSGATNSAALSATSSVISDTGTGSSQTKTLKAQVTNYTTEVKPDTYTDTVTMTVTY